MWNSMNKGVKLLSKQHKIIFSILACGITLLISGVISWDDKPVMGVDKLIGDIIITLFCLYLIRIIGIWDTAGFRKKGFLLGLKLGIPFLIIGVGGAVLGNIGVDIQKLVPLSPATFIMFTINMFMVGVNEEITVRSLVLNNLLHNEEYTYKKVLKAVFLSAAIFGALHITNIVFEPPITLIVSVINAASAGVLFAAIFIRSKNIWSAIIIHMLVDWLALLLENCFIGGSSVLGIEMGPVQGILMILVGSTPPLLIALFLLRKSIFQRAEIPYETNSDRTAIEATAK